MLHKYLHLPGSGWRLGRARSLLTPGLEADGDGVPGLRLLGGGGGGGGLLLPGELRGQQLLPQLGEAHLRRGRGRDAGRRAGRGGEITNDQGSGVIRGSY